MPRLRSVLVTGFEPYGGFMRNPSAEIARGLDGRRIDGFKVVGRVLPVDLAALPAALEELFEQVEPVAAIMLGLAPGEATIRLERVALNLADFAIPDNAGTRVADRPLDRRSGPALWARLPLRRIQAALLAAGIPARLSESAGTYLCNAALHHALRALPRRVACGFIHLPLLPSQAAEAIARAPAAPILSSMALPVQRRAVELVVRLTLESGVPSRSPRA